MKKSLLPKGVIAISLGLLVSACGVSKTPADKLTYEQQEQVVSECRKTGKMATDDYCKEVAWVFEPEERRRREMERIKRAQADRGVPFAGWSHK